MTAPVLADALGPRARRKVAVLSVAVGLVIAGLVAVALARLSSNGQLEWRLWEPMTQGPVLRFFGRGLLSTLKVAGVSMALALVLGSSLALLRLSRSSPVAWLAGAYVQLFRSMPLVLIILFSALALPKYGVKLSLFWYLVIALVAYNGAVLGEIFRAGILSLERGQAEAAYAIGMGYWQAMRLVVVPQAVRRMVPAIVSQLVTLLKDTSLGFVIAYQELLSSAKQNGQYFKNPLQSYVFVALVYIAVNYVLSRLARHLEQRQRRRYRASSIDVGGIEDLAVVQAQR